MIDYPTHYEAVKKVIEEYSKTHVILSLNTISGKTGFPPEKIKDCAYEIAFKYGIEIGLEDVSHPAVF